MKKSVDVSPPSGPQSTNGFWPARPFDHLFFHADLGISVYPEIVPPSITIWEAAAPPESQAFLLVGAIVLVPTILAYTAYAYWVFRGKTVGGYH